MKITKQRLLQIIREEVELHDKNSQENPDDASTTEPLTTGKTGRLSDEDKNQVIDKAIKGKMEEESDSGTTEEDQIIDPKSKKVIKPPKNTGKIEIKIR